MTPLISHPVYPVRPGHPEMDRCVCGGVRHWHGVAPYGCDDCPCTEFVLRPPWKPGRVITVAVNVAIEDGYDEEQVAEAIFDHVVDMDDGRIQSVDGYHFRRGELPLRLGEGWR